MPCPAPAAAASRPRRPAPAARPAPRSWEGGRRGRGPPGVGGADQRGGSRPGPLSPQRQPPRGPSRRPPRPASPRRPERGGLGCPVSCEAGTWPRASRRHRLRPRRAPWGSPPAARPRGSARGCRAGAGRGAGSRAPAGPPCAGCAPCAWRAPCWPPRCSLRAARPPPPPSSRDSASRTRSRTRARPRWVPGPGGGGPGGRGVGGSGRGGSRPGAERAPGSPGLDRTRSSGADRPRPGGKFPAVSTESWCRENAGRGREGRERPVTGSRGRRGPVRAVGKLRGERRPRAGLAGAQGGPPTGGGSRAAPGRGDAARAVSPRTAPHPEPAAGARARKRGGTWSPGWGAVREGGQTGDATGGPAGPARATAHPRERVSESAGSAGREGGPCAAVSQISDALTLRLECRGEPRETFGSARSRVRAPSGECSPTELGLTRGPPAPRGLDLPRRPGDAPGSLLRPGGPCGPDRVASLLRGPEGKLTAWN